MCLHTIIEDPNNPERIFIAISAAGADGPDQARRGFWLRPAWAGHLSKDQVTEPCQKRV
jgi:hypothetical protein